MIEAGGDHPQHRLQEAPRGVGAAGHERGARARALGPAGDAEAHVQKARVLGVGGAAVGVGPVGIAAVDDHVARVEKRVKGGDLLVHRLARRNHQENAARPGDGGHKLGQGGRGHDVGGEILGHGLGHQVVDARGAARLKTASGSPVLGDV